MTRYIKIPCGCALCNAYMAAMDKDAPLKCGCAPGKLCEHARQGLVMLHDGTEIKK